MTSAWLEWFVGEEAGGLPGRPRAARLLGLDPSSESAAERDLKALLQRAAVPAFECQYRIALDGRTSARVDFAWPSVLVALELDGYRYHSAPAAFVRGRQRGNEIELAGWTLLRTTPFEVREQPDRLVEKLSRAISTRRCAQPGGSPAGAG